MRSAPNTSSFQSFDDPSEGDQGPKRLAELRSLMQQMDLNVWLIPHGDEHQNEYPPAHAQRLGWLTGFTGSAGFCIVTMHEAVVFADGRYTLQLVDQIDTDHFTPGDLVNDPPHKWLANWLDGRDDDQPARIGYDAWLTTINAHKHFEKAIAGTSAALVSEQNLIDKTWEDQPHPPLEPITIQPDEFSGKLALHKLDALKVELAKSGADYCLISDPSSIAWAFNIRGGDTPHTPLAIGYAILRADGYPLLFMDKRKMSREVEAYLTQLADLHPPSTIDEQLAELAPEATILADPANTSIALAHAFTNNGGELRPKPDPIILPRAIKNDAEIAGSKNAHLRDGVAVTKFLYWLDQQPPGSVDEIAAAQSLEDFRTKTAQKFESKLLDLSFDTISGAGANGAIVHYRVTTDSNAVLENNSLYLVDSGAQYRDGTTDITRTIAIGTPLDLAVEDFTLVLKGHIAIALARFPEGTRGVDIDALARMALWQKGRDYAHGTGHGIGAYLAVHEGPQSISRRGMAKLEPGMIVSNEPGFYREGQYGIRIENLVLVKGPLDLDDGNIPILGFQTLSLAPIDLRLIDPNLLEERELHWLNAYHGWVKRKLSPHLNDDEAQWLEQATRPISKELPAASA